ncbi:GNAT family N-acetyltransferase [Spirulina subsalsa FACHB-351]|uniref:GNAT family N-acetyltransferase n=1 Tax=Spirulina subsalsa FACHB-351 TaxID=234711 RepID=A0ABT3L070_9CYAN|nr:GNAT family N-acetyltransferase [Spirulina subsalsa]MCW6034901.1 GNAT family N-acetyltransferase [Spirulina subsalsa FACHB-351]
MTSSVIKDLNLEIRPLQLRDLDGVEQLVNQVLADDHEKQANHLRKTLMAFRQWYGLLKLLRLFPNPTQDRFCLYVAARGEVIYGLIHVSPFNRTRTTWRVEKILVNPALPAGEKLIPAQDVGSHLLRHCLETIWEARTWLLEVNVNDNESLGIYRQNGFQPLAQLTYWAIAPDLLKHLAATPPTVPNLLPVSNADAQLLYQLDTVSMPPLLRQVFDRHILDFKTPFWQALLDNLKKWFNQQERVQGYVFEPQRKAAIGYFDLKITKNGVKAHKAQLTVHPAYTWLYPELLSQMALAVQDISPQTLLLASADYQPEREEYLEKLGAERTEHTLLMSRSVWHKLRETKHLEGLQLSDVLQGLQPARTPVPSRMSWMRHFQHHKPAQGGENGAEHPPEAHS